VKCPSGFISGTTKLRFKGGVNQWWWAAQPQDFQHQITKMTVNGQSVQLGTSKFSIKAPKSTLFTLKEQF